MTYLGELYDRLTRYVNTGQPLRDINGDTIHFLDRLEYCPPYAQRFHLLNGAETFPQVRSRPRLLFIEHPRYESEQMKDVILLRYEFVFVANPGNLHYP